MTFTDELAAEKAAVAAEVDALAEIYRRAAIRQNAPNGVMTKLRAERERLNHCDCSRPLTGKLLADASAQRESLRWAEWTKGRAG